MYIDTDSSSLSFKTVDKGERGDFRNPARESNIT